MTASRKRFTQEFKDELCREVISTSKPIKDAATAYGVGPETLRNWLIKYREANGGKEADPTVSERARLKELEREVQDLRAETAFLNSPDRVGLDLGACSSVREGVGDEFGAHLIGDGPADDLLRVAVDDVGYKPPSFSWPPTNVLGGWTWLGCGGVRRRLPMFSSLGPWLLSADSIDVSNPWPRSLANGEPRGDSNTSEMIVDLSRIARELSQHMNLYPGHRA